MAIDPSFTLNDLATAAISACNGALLAHDPQHYKKFKVLGVIWLAIIAGLSGSIVRDVIVNSLPAAMTNPWYVIVAFTMALVGLFLFHIIPGKHLGTVTQILTAITIPWLSIVSAQKGFEAQFGLFPGLLMGVIGGTTGRLLLDVLCGTTSRVLLRGDWYIGTALFTSLSFVVLRESGLSFIVSTIAANILGLAVSFLLLYRH
jgi:uncharacterized membrane protein YeiH